MNTQNAGRLTLFAHVRRNPYRAMLIAAGVGYVLGGGLFTRLTFNALRVGLRMGALPLVRRELLDVAESALSARSHSST